ncbi:MAG: bifunctional DNA-formamidopyrimidine glycosylase/DNA-(apurinic or apyrimidinic site) lyase [Bifidobacterium tibiigranuli]|jgi:formamidopyrimidine-DNA glycosylase|uniref:bifunctional DNA-formamidopyrimidine glycosylase/DNA-(apurinic or apyrimidinic site) lyase n=1 Tax=Bifidobacterium tibiigranuli TaxID=2172043 RepID=UPI0026E9FC33|nr:bifunctional DNA-formamidopyrimidine glycosylase/DNA-(apurinic or apyrimidinic site) lyase [Bifidobacterium tibiigranuli]MCI1674085.1 bifunctional DNA-formamidopyrimidine glycosylase/DNA-(apurinic or apyrimidinic site) lyase [Bifidobacterium tibiigranuli]MCI1712862.1 bifunctional DNA-formamidopyrimidine glycosylase/DNA-(apurinic or apyrimidinic site) lyase [Bifidobacterium tibiigranuli]MCI1834164.1 bifunctional DNA-formamidopyrimidine glycosylase/DNA-(apurinic or apyrimidinic site) lyase [Bif
MPELPEVETVRRGLAAHITGATCTGVDVIDERILRRHGAPAAPHPSGNAFAHSLEGRRIVAVERRGKFLWMPLDGLDDGVWPARSLNMRPVRPSQSQHPSEALTAHLGMSGQLLLREPEAALQIPVFSAPSAAPASSASSSVSHGKQQTSAASHDDKRSRVALALAGPHVRARLQLVRDDGRPVELSFVDQRIFGRLAVEPLADDGRGRSVPNSVADIAPDPLEPAFDEEAVIARMRASRASIKALLLDQRLISGVGNIYADEALWRSRIYWARAGCSIAPRTLHRLLTSVREVFAESLAQGGTSFDSLYVNVNGESGYFSRSLNAYGRAGKPCPRCGTPIRRERFGSRSSYYCPRCQRRR